MMADVRLKGHSRTLAQAMLLVATRRFDSGSCGNTPLMRGPGAGVDRESTRRLWAFVLLYPLGLAVFVLLGVGFFTDADQSGRYEWAEPAAIRIPLAAAATAVLTIVTFKRVQTLREPLKRD